MIERIARKEIIFYNALSMFGNEVAIGEALSRNPNGREANLTHVEK